MTWAFKSRIIENNRKCHDKITHIKSSAKTSAKPRNKSGYTAYIVNKHVRPPQHRYKIYSVHVCNQQAPIGSRECTKKKRLTLMLVSSQTFNEVPCYTTPGHVSPKKSSPRPENSKASTFPPKFNHLRQLHATLIPLRVHHL